MSHEMSLFTRCIKPDLLRQMRRTREGAVIVEVAIVCPIVFLLIIGIAVCGIASFRRHQVTALSSEGARWAAINAKTYANSHKGVRPPKQDMFNAAIKPLAGSLDPDKLTYEVTWDETNLTVSVSVTYQVLPQFMGKTFTAHSESICAILQ